MQTYELNTERSKCGVCKLRNTCIPVTGEVQQNKLLVKHFIYLNKIINGVRLLFKDTFNICIRFDPVFIYI